MNTSLSRQNSFNAFDSIMELMHNDQFRRLFDSHFNDYTDIQTIILIMKTYQYLEELYINMTGHKPSIEYMKSGIKKLIADHKVRPFLVQSTKKFMENQNMETFASIIQEKKDLIEFNDS